MLESIDDIDEQPVIIEDDDMSLDIIELSSEDIEEQSSEDDINEDIAEPSIADSRIARSLGRSPMQCFLRRAGPPLSQVLSS